MTDYKVKELLAATKALMEWSGYDGSANETERVLDAIAAFEPPKLRRGELWVNEYPAQDCFYGYTTKEKALESKTAVCTAVHYREVLPGDENLVIVKPASEWTDGAVEKLHTAWVHEGSLPKAYRAVITAIRDMGRV